MNVDLLTISNMLMGTTNPTVASSKSDTSKKTSQFSLIGNDNPQQENAAETQTTDNVRFQAQEEPDAGQTQDIVDTPQEEIISKTPQLAKGSEKSKEQVLSNGAFSENNTAQPVLTKGTPVEVILPVENSAANAVSNQEGSNTPIQTILTNQTDKVIPATVQSQNVTQTTLNVPAQTAPETEEGSVSLTTSGNQKQLENAVSEIIKDQSANNTAQTATVSIDTDQMQNNAVAGTNKSIVPENGEKTEVGKVTTGSKTIVADVNIKEKVSESSTEEQSREASILNNKRLISKYTVGSDIKATNIDQNKTATLTTDSSSVQVKTTESQVEPVVINPEKFVPDTDKTNVDKNDNSQMLSNSLQNRSKETILGESDSSSESNIQKLKIADVQMSSDQIKGRDNTNATSGNNSGSDFGQMLQNNNVQVPVAEQSQNVAENTKTTGTQTQDLQNDVSADVGKQILESIQNSVSRQSGDQQITVRLNPPELGKVYVKFQEQDNQITGLMEVSKTQTRFEVEQALPQIIRNLADSGIQIRRFEVVLNNSGESEQEAVKDQLLQDGGAQHHGSANSDGHDNNTGAMGINEWLAGNSPYRNVSEIQEMPASEGSINVLL